MTQSTSFWSRYGSLLLLGPDGSARPTKLCKDRHAEAFKRHGFDLESIRDAKSFVEAFTFVQAMEAAHEKDRLFNGAPSKASVLSAFKESAYRADQIFVPAPLQEKPKKKVHLSLVK